MTDEVVEEPTSRVSPLGSLQARRKEIQEKLFIDLKVPRWISPEVVVRYKALEPTELTKLLERRADKKTADNALWANCDILVNACVAVYGVLEGDYEHKYSLRLGDENGSWTKFDPDLARNLLGEAAAPAAKAVNVVRELYQTDGDLITAAGQVLEFSGIASEQVAEDF